MRNRTLPFFLSIAAALCGTARGEDRMLAVYTWEEYFSPRAIALFEMAHNCEVEFSYYDSNDTMVQTLRQGGGYDILTPSGMDATVLREEGLIRDLDHALLPNLANLSPDTPARIHDPALAFSVPYTITVTGVAYSADAVPAERVGTWDIFGDARLRGRMAMLNDLREPLGAALRSLGLSANTESAADLDAAAKLLVSWKRNVARFSTNEARENLRKGVYAAIQTYNGEFAHASRFNNRLRFFVPREGSMLNSDQLAIGADTESADLAHAFIDFFLRPDIAAINMEDIDYMMPNDPALEIVRGKIRNSDAFFFPPEVLARCEVIRNVGASIALYDAAWEKVLFSDEGDK